MAKELGEVVGDQITEGLHKEFGFYSKRDGKGPELWEQGRDCVSLRIAEDRSWGCLGNRL